jgi:5-methylcytosine-specific restriction endonuclease McrA
MAWDCLPFEDKGLFHWTKQWEAQQAYQVFVELRNRRADYMTKLEADVLVPKCEDCYARERRELEEQWEPPDIRPQSWKEDLRQFGVSEDEIEHAEKSGLSILCIGCHRDLTYVKEPVYVHTVSFQSYFEGLLERGRKRLRPVVFDAYERRCFGCGRELTWSEVGFDHIFPESKGGEAELVNLQPLCEQCGNKKADQEPAVVSYHFHFCLVPPPSDGYEGVVW